MEAAMLEFIWEIVQLSLMGYGIYSLLRQRKVNEKLTTGIENVWARADKAAQMTDLSRQAYDHAHRAEQAMHRAILDQDRVLRDHKTVIERLIIHTKLPAPQPSDAYEAEPKETITS